MVKDKFHEDEVEINLEIVRSLLLSQFPDLADGELAPIHPQGTDNKMYRLGESKVVRLPRIEGSVPSLQKEIEWLPLMAEKLSISVPVPTHVGVPSDDYPFPWVICDFFSGKSPSNNEELRQDLAANDLSNFINSMHKIDATNGPKCGRGMHINVRDNAVQKSIPLLGGDYDPKYLTSLWKKIVAANEWQNPPVWIHGDLHLGNILASDKRISAVVDFGLCGVGDPSCDYMAAWTLLTKESRATFRSQVKANDDCWLKAMGWAFSMGVLGYPYYKETNPDFANMAKGALDAALEDFDD